jgi:cell wall-associated NlpC family hydrolase
MSEQQEQRPSVVQTMAGVLIRGALATKGGFVAVVLAVVVLGLFTLVLGCGAIGAAFQSSTAVWPVPAATTTSGGYQSAGVAVTSRFGWRDNPQQPGTAEFHDGVDLAGPALCRRCPTAALFDAQVTYVGWDEPGAANPATAAGGQTVRIESGEGAYEVLYAHLEPYRLYVQLQGRIEDRYGRYDEYRDYAPVGRGELQPEGEIAIQCDGDMPQFVASRLGDGTLLFEYDRPATCRTSVTWGHRGDRWEGWLPDEPAGREGESVVLHWSTPVDSRRMAGDVALRFRAHLVPPPPPPTATPVISTTLPIDGATPPGVASMLTNGRCTSADAPACHSERSAPRDSVPSREDCTAREAKNPSLLCAETAARCFATPAPDAVSPTGDIGMAGSARHDTGSPCTWRIAEIPRHTMQAWDADAGRGSTSAGQVARQEATPTPLAATPAEPPRTAPQLGVVLTASRTAPAIGQVVHLTATIFNDDIVASATTVRADLGQYLELLEVWTGSGSCAGTTCDIQTGGRPATVRMTARVRADAPPRARSVVRVEAEASHVMAHDSVTLEIADLVIEEPWPPPTAVPTATPDPIAAPASPGPLAPTAPVAPDPLTAPCYRAVAAALSRQGARYSQGGALAGDPRGANGLPLPRTGPSSFDCSGLVWWSYAQAGLPVGRTTYEQLDDGVLLPCTLSQLRGVFTTCWAPGDLVFLRYPAGQHVAIYAGSGLFMDCFNHRVGCVLHDVSRDPFYQAHFLQARRIVSGCEDLALDPGAPVPPPLDGEPQGDAEGMCVIEQPTFTSPVETLAGCGPPVRLGERVFQLDSTVGFVGLSGATSGPHLHLGLRARSYDGGYHTTNICTAAWLRGRIPPPDADCWTEMADPLDFLPRSHGGEQGPGGTPLPEGAPYQLPPPGASGALVLTPQPGDAPLGQYWSPHADGGQYGGVPALDWLRNASCAAWKELPWCK